MIPSESLCAVPERQFDCCADCREKDWPVSKAAQCRIHGVEDEQLRDEPQCRDVLSVDARQKIVETYCRGQRQGEGAGEVDQRQQIQGQDAEASSPVEIKRFCPGVDRMAAGNEVGRTKKEESKAPNLGGVVPDGVDMGTELGRIVQNMVEPDDV